MAGRVSTVFLLIGAMFLAVSIQEIYGQVGGLSRPMKATPEIQGYIDQVRPEVESEVNRALEKYVAKIYRVQLVNGLNYFIKVHTGGAEYMHIRLYKTFEGDVSFVSVQAGKTIDDKLRYF